MTLASVCGVVCASSTLVFSASAISGGSSTACEIESILIRFEYWRRIENTKRQTGQKTGGAKYHGYLALTNSM